LNAQALEMAQSGVSIVFLSEAVFNASESAESYYSNVPATDLVENTHPVLANGFNPVIIAALVGVIICLVLLLFFMRRQAFASGAENKKISLEKAKARLDKLFADKKISYANYLEMNSILESRTKEIDLDKEALSQAMVKTDKMRFELQALKRTLAELERQKKSGLVTKKDFEKTVSKIKSKSGYLEKALGEKRKDAALEETKIKLETKEYSKEAKEMLRPARKEIKRKLQKAKK
jgi:hypothetical protein